MFCVFTDYQFFLRNLNIADVTIARLVRILQENFNIGKV
jgi:hypothetical protein